jgi:hypothetical protein
LRSGAPDEEVERLVRLSIALKPRGHNMKIQSAGLRKHADNKNFCMRPMSRIGG